MTDLYDLIKENGYQKAVTEMLLAFPWNETKERQEVRAKLWNMAFPDEKINNNEYRNSENRPQDH